MSSASNPAQIMCRSGAVKLAHAAGLTAGDDKESENEGKTVTIPQLGVKYGSKVGKHGGGKRARFYIVDSVQRKKKKDKRLVKRRKERKGGR